MDFPLYNGKSGINPDGFQYIPHPQSGWFFKKPLKEAYVYVFSKDLKIP